MNMLNDHCEIFLADTPESKEIHYKIRYDVYCDEMGFENKADFPQEMERDENDDEGKSVHFIARNKITGQWIGAMRLIFKQDGLLPIEQSCELKEDIIANDLENAVELSRLCLIKDIRRRFKDIDPPHGIAEDEMQQKPNNKVVPMPSHRQFSRMVLWGLLHAAVEYGHTNKIKNSYFMTTTALAKILGRGGLNLINIGGPCEHKGERFPFRMDTEEVYQSDAWKKDFSCGYSLFSEQSVATASAA
jgi:N-acyl amino acid synthase of PEP-CTERM/exosortase system